MIEEFIRKSMKVAVYQHKKGTKSSYYWQQGSKILPGRLSISRGNEMTNVQHKGRNAMHPVVGQLIGAFKVAEESLLKKYKPFVCRTQIWQVPLYPLFIGYGTIGITNYKGNVRDTGDLIVMHSTDQWESISIFYFAGMGNPSDMPQVMRFLTSYVENGN